MNLAISSFEIHDVHRVQGFLAQHPHVSAILSTAYLEIAKVFPGCVLHLEVCRDSAPAAGLPPRYLRLRVVTTLSEAHARVQFRHLVAAWWGQAAPKGQGHLSISVESIVKE